MPAMAVIRVEHRRDPPDTGCSSRTAGRDTAKVPRPAPEQERSVVEAARLALDAARAPPLERFRARHDGRDERAAGRKGARDRRSSATRGLRAPCCISSTRTGAHLHRLDVDHPGPLVPAWRLPSAWTSALAGRRGHAARPLSLPEIDADAIAVCLLFSFRDGSHERRSLQSCTDGIRMRGRRSHEVAPEFREYERASTTTVDAYLGPLTARYLTALGASAADAGLPAPLVMRSSGGVATIEEAAAHPALILLSGPAAGVVAAERIAADSGVANAIAFDMGGTSTDVCLIARQLGPIGGPGRRRASRSASRWSTSTRSGPAGARGLAGPQAAPCGSAPESAGAVPGPACYGRGGEQPTVTDANLLLGRSRSASRRARARPRRGGARTRGLDPADVIDVSTPRCCGRCASSRSSGPRSARLRARRVRWRRPVARCALAEELGCARVLVPDAAGVSPRSASSRAMRVATRSGRRSPARRGGRPAGRRRSEPSPSRSVARTHGRSGAGGASPQRFHGAREDRYGYADRTRPVELVARQDHHRRARPTTSG